MDHSRYFKMVSNAIDFIEGHLREPIGVQEVCAISRMSPWQFQRLFRLYTADSIGIYIRSRRLTCAALDLIRNPQRRILDVAIEYQFGSQEAFTRAFKKMFEVTPGEVTAFTGKMRLRQKVKLSDVQLEHNLKGIQRDPDFQVFPERSFLGREILIPSPFSDDTSYIQKVSDLWLRFNPERKNIANRVQGVGYGLVLSPGGAMFEDHFPYVASVELGGKTAVDLPVDLKFVKIPSHTYATFEKRGLADKTRMSLDYIYGFWLPQSGYRRALGYDIEIFDHRLRLDQPESVSLYCIPIESK
jgi:AraC family transcriptional regulator